MLILPSPFLLLFLITIPFHVNSQSPATTDRSILLNLKQQWGDPPSIESWNASSSPCDWPEIICANTTVTGIFLPNKNITGKIPATICDLRNLTVINLSNNNIPGPFPTVLYNCSNLRYLDLSQNYFVGAIPAEIDRISNLQYLDLGANNFSGTIPPAIGRLPELQSLYLYENEFAFAGTFPKEIGNLSNLVNLGLAYNDFAPTAIPAEFGNLKNLKFMWMTGSNLIGELPESFDNLTSLEHLDLSGNNLNGPIPRGLFMLKNLSVVYLYSNRLSGEIPSTIESLSVTEIDISMNNLTGSVPSGFGNLQNLTILNLDANQLTGNISSTIGLLPNLKFFRVFSNNLSGILPPELGLHSNLEAFEVSDNGFTGPLPENLCSGGALTGVVAFSNRLTGGIPESLGNCSTLRTVQLYDNNFSGEVPTGLWTALNLSSLMLSNNSFSGELPSRLAWNMSRLEIGNNNFSGPIPVGVSSWLKLVVFKASNNQFSGGIPVELTGLDQLTTLMLDGNHLTGELPSDISSWNSLTNLNLARNNLYGQIPAAIGSLPDLLDLDLSRNQFSGAIPPQLAHLKLTSLNLSSNQLSGTIPIQFDNMAYENSFLNNTNLCAQNPISNIPRCSTKSSESETLSPRIVAMIVVLVALVCAVTVLLILFVIRDFNRKKQRSEIGKWKLTSFQRLDFTEANVLSSLTESNLIGSGGSGKVYKIAVNSLGDNVAVKRIWSNRNLDHNLEKEFLAEVQILGSIRHSNIVKLLCCISSEGSKILVYEYMEKQSLDRWLHRKRGASVMVVNGADRVFALDWPRRLQIAVGAAQGLCYMHHDCSPPIVHRDVKSSNILLDSEFNARIADFGLAKILVKHGEPNTMSGIAGSFGYLAPEYAYTTKVNEKIDVYSFGVVLLELTTGREANVGDEHTSLAEWAWRHHGEGNSVAAALDEEIKEPCYLEEMSTVFRLGLICTSTLPSSRPSMKDVLQILRRCSAVVDGEDGKKGQREYDVAPLLGTAKYLASYRRSKRVSDGADDDSLVVLGC